MKRAATLFALTAMLALPGAVMAADETFSADLTTADEVPAPTGSDGSGSAMAVISDDSSQIEYEYSYQDLTGDPIMAHIHFGQPGVAGPVMIPLGVGASPVSGTLTEADFMAVENGPQTFAEALDAIRDGGTYVNVHTEMNQAGEIRGQLEAEDLPPTDATGGAAGNSLWTALLGLVAAAALVLGVRRFAFQR